MRGLYLLVCTFKKFTWTKNGEPFIWNTNNGWITEEFHEIEKEAIITINRPKTSDAGVYQCFATNDYGVSRGSPINIIEVGRLQINSKKVKMCF